MSEPSNPQDNLAPRRRWLSTMMAFAVGLAAGFISLILGSHGPVWPTILLCAPASLAGGLLSSMLDNEVAYVGFMVVGTAAFYAMYAGAFAILPKIWAVLTVATVHGASIGLLAMLMR